MKAIINARIYDYHELKENSYVIFDEKIREVGPMSDFWDSGFDEIIDLGNDLLLPGFVSAHTHLYSAFARGLNLEFNPANFKEILEQLWWKLDHFLDKEMIYFSAYSFGLEQLLTGTTTFIDHHASHEIEGTLVEIKKALVDELGVRAILAFETSDRFDVSGCIKENRDFIQNNNDDSCRGLFGMHASFTLCDKSLEMIRENLAGAGIHIHIAESKMDEDASLEKHGKTVVKRLDDFNLINDKSILVHCVNVTEDELDIIKKRDAYVAVNVTSNLNNAVGLPNIALMQKKGIKLMIGNDGLIPSMPIEYINAYYASHLKSDSPVGFSIDGIKQAIINSHEYASIMLHTKIGRIKEEYVSDFISVPYVESSPLDEFNIFSHLFFGLFPNLKPKNVIVKGQRLVKDYQAKSEFLENIPKAEKQAKRLWELIEKEGKNLEFKY